MLESHIFGENATGSVGHGVALTAPADLKSYLAGLGTVDQQDQFRAVRHTQALLTVLLTSCQTLCADSAVLKPLWRREAMQRRESILQLVFALEARVHHGAKQRIAWQMERSLAKCLAERYNVLAAEPDRSTVPCSAVLRDVLEGSVNLFGQRMELRLEIEEIFLPAYKRRALVLAASSLAMRTLMQLGSSVRSRELIAALYVTREGQGRLAVSNPEDIPPNLRIMPFYSIVNQLAEVLEGETTYHDFGPSRSFITVDFPLRS